MLLHTVISIMLFYNFFHWGFWKIRRGSQQKDDLQREDKFNLHAMVIWQITWLYILYSTLAPIAVMYISVTYIYTICNCHILWILLTQFSINFSFWLFFNPVSVISTLVNRGCGCMAWANESDTPVLLRVLTAEQDN